MKKQEHVSKYWYTKTALPDEKCAMIKRLVRGQLAGHISFGSSQRKLLKVSGIVFKKVFMENRKFLYKGDYTAPCDENNYLGAMNYLTDDGLAGFSITNTGWLVSLFSNQSDRGFANAVKQFVVPRAYKLVCIVTAQDESRGLVAFYGRNYGFRSYVKTIDDVDVMRKHYGDAFIEAFVARHGVPFHVFMIGRDAVGEEQDIKAFADYFDAEKFVEGSVTRMTIARNENGPVH